MSDSNNGFNNHLVPAELIGGSLRGTTICADATFEDIRARLFEGRIVILKGCFKPELMIEFRSALQRWSTETPPYPHGKSLGLAVNENHHRKDEGTYPSAISHIFHQYA